MFWLKQNFICSGLGAHGWGHRSHAPVLGLSHGLFFPNFHLNSSGVGQAASISRSDPDSDRSILASEGMIPRTAPSSSRASSGNSSSLGSSVSASRSEVSSKSPRAKASCLETLKQFARASGFSSGVAKRLGSARRPSSIANYQSKWAVYLRWCMDTGRLVSSLSVSKVIDYLLWLWETITLSVSTIKAHRSMLSTVFHFKLPELGEHHVLHDLSRSFAIERPHHPPMPQSWDLEVVPRHLMS